MILKVIHSIVCIPLADYPTYMSLFTHSITCVARTDQSSADNAKVVGLMAVDFAKKGWHFAQKQQSLGTHIGPGTLHTPGGTRRYSTLSTTRRLPCQTQTVSHHSKIAPMNWYSCRATDDSLIALMTGDTDSFPPQLREIREKLAQFMQELVLPSEKEVFDHQLSTERWTPLPLIEELKVSLSPFSVSTIIWL